MLTRLLTGILCALSLFIASQVFADNNWLSAQSNPGFNPSPGDAISTTALSPISFDIQTHEGKSIKANPNLTTFCLKKGSYLVTFTGTFQNLNNAGLANIDIGFQVESDCLTQTLYLKRFFTSSIRGTELITTSGIITAKRKTTLQVVAQEIKLTIEDLGVEVHNRNISIIRLSD